MKSLNSCVSRVTYDRGEDNGGEIEAYVVDAGDGKNLVLAAFVSGTFQLLNNGHPVPERAEGGGVTWKHK